MEQRELEVVAEALQDILAAKMRGVATDAGLVRVRYDYASSGLEATLTRENGTESTFKLSVTLHPERSLRRVSNG
jgi:hypothetical protein